MLLLSLEKDQVWRWELIDRIEDAVIARMFLGDETVINIQRDRGIVSVEKKRMRFRGWNTNLARWT